MGRSWILRILEKDLKNSWVEIQITSKSTGNCRLWSRSVMYRQHHAGISTSRSLPEYMSRYLAPNVCTCARIRLNRRCISQ